MIWRKIIPEIEKELESFKSNIVITGMRRVGKTTLLKYLYDNLKNSRKIFLDLESPLNHSFFEEIDYDKILLNLDSKAEGLGEKLYVFLDEIQNVKNIPSVAKYLSDHNKVKFVMTGSASFYLKNLFTESLAGRKRIFEIFPLNFEEYLEYKGQIVKEADLSIKTDSFSYHLHQKYWDEYQKFGGFPSVVLLSTEAEKMNALSDIYSSYYQNEVLKLSDFKKLESFRKIMKLLIDRTGNKLDITKISQELGIARITVYEYLEFLEGTYFISKIRRYSKSIDVTIRSQEKVYICDTGILTLLNGVSGGAIFENAIFNQIKPMGEIMYYQTESDLEVDFIVKNWDRKMAIEVKNHATYKDVERLTKLSNELKIKKHFVVSQEFVNLDKVIYPFQLSNINS